MSPRSIYYTLHSFKLTKRLPSATITLELVELGYLEIDEFAPTFKATPMLTLKAEQLLAADIP